MSFYFAQFLTGLSSASSLFLVACGLSLIFGVTRIVNFAHGSFYMLGAYMAYTLVQYVPGSILGFWGSVLAAALIVALVGVVIEMVVLRRIYNAPELYQLVATFGIVLIVQDAVLWIFGSEDRLGPRAPGLDGVVRIFGEPIPQYDLVLIALGPAVLALMWLLLNRTRWGVLVRAATLDREMVASLGVNQSWLFTSVFFLGSFLAGLGGALQVPRVSINLLMDLSIIAEAFVVVVIGGMGSIPGAFVAALLIGELNAFGVLVLPEATIVLAFVVMAVVLVIRPYGLFGKQEAAAHAAGQVEAPIRPASPLKRAVALALLAFMVVLPFIMGEFAMVLATDILIFALFAASLHFIMGNGGMVSFGHAAYFALGCYGAAFLVKYFGGSMELALVAGPLFAGLGALVFGWFCVRLSGVYMAMLTLAAAQIVWSTAFQWQDLTGGDDGLLGIWPSDWARSKTAFYYLSLALCGGGILLLRRMIFSPFGYALRGGRDNPNRTESIGIDLRAHQWAAFVTAGVFAGVAGGVYVFSKGSIFPDEAAIPRSVDALVMVLLGGVQTLSGPVVGAGVFRLLEDEISRLDYWRAILGGIIVTIVIIAPEGIAGFIKRIAIKIGLERDGEAAR
ncbi:MAG: ABC transporter permease [Anderseniella sp.]|jgi:branched-chain amino acid transport system permease protein|nr:ABC transporter permease [Anderseniella sp.]